MKNKKTRKIMSFVTTCCLLLGLCTTSIGAETNNVVMSDVVQNLSDTGIMPCTMYLSGGGISYSRVNSSKVGILITTRANTSVQSIYHDVVIYKNGTLVYSGRSNGSGKTSLNTYKEFSAKEGDFFSTYTTHYVSHSGSTEHCNSHEDFYF